MKISSTENKQIFDALVANPDNYNKFAGELLEFNVMNKQPCVRIPATWLTPSVLYVDDQVVVQFNEFLHKHGCNVSIC
jgi:hypothetical protein